MDNVVHNTSMGQVNSLLDIRISPPKQPKLIFPHLGSYVVFNNFKSSLEKVVKVVWIFSRKNYYKSIEFWTDHDHCFFLDDLRSGLVDTVWPRKSIQIGFDAYYQSKSGEAIREQLIHPKGDHVFEGVQA